MKVFLCEDIHPQALALLKSRAEVVACVDRLAEVDAIISRNLHLDRAFLARCTRLKVVGIHGVGCDGVDLAAASQRRIAVVCVPGENADSVAELIVALALVLARKIHLADRTLLAGGAAPSGSVLFQGMELRGKTLGLVGVGDIALRAAHMCKAAFQMRVVGYAPSLTAQRAAACGIGRCETAMEVLAQADVISIGVPLNAHTRGLIGTAQLAAAKPGAILINTARGGVVDENALYCALVEGPLGAAACDVFCTEPPTRANPLVGLPNFVATPHIGATTEEALLRVGKAIVTKVFQALDAAPPAE